MVAIFGRGLLAACLFILGFLNRVKYLTLLIINVGVLVSCHLLKHESLSEHLHIGLSTETSGCCSV